MKISRKEFVEEYAIELGISKRSAAEQIKTYQSLISAHLEMGNSVHFAGFGNYIVRERLYKDESGNVEKTTRRPAFKPGKPLIDLVK